MVTIDGKAIVENETMPADLILIKTEIGATDSAVVAAGAEGNVSAKLRRLTADIGTLKDDTALIKSDIDEINAKLGTLPEVAAGTNLNAVTSTGAGADITMTAFKTITFQIIASIVTDGGTVTIEATLDGTNYTVIDTTVITADGSNIYSTQEGKPYLAVRANLSARTDGTYTVLYIRS